MLRNREEKEENSIYGVNLVMPPTKLKLGYFTTLQNWIPSKKYKIKKKRGVSTLTGPPFPTIIRPHQCGVPVTKSLAFECGSECPLGQFAQAEFIYDENDITIGGPAIRIESDSTDDSFYGLGAVYDRFNEKIILAFWDYQTLDTLLVSQNLAEYNVALITGDVLKIEADSASPFTYYVKVNGSTVITYTDSGHVIDIQAPCIGWITVAAVVIE